MLSFNQTTRVVVTRHFVKFEYSHDFKHGVVSTKPRAELLQILESLEQYLPLALNNEQKLQTNIQKIIKNDNQYIVVICTEISCKNFILYGNITTETLQDRLITSLRQILDILQGK